MLYTDRNHNCFAKDPAVVSFNGQYFMYYTLTYDDGRLGIGIARSSDMENWETLGDIPQDRDYEAKGTAAPGAVILRGQIHLFYQTYGNWEHDAICHAVSDDGIHFAKNPENPVYAPEKDWCVGRAIDADVCLFRGRLYMYFATRDHAMKIQKVGGAWADPASDFGRNAWNHVSDCPILAPELSWEGECIEAPATLVRGGKVYMFYGGSYNCTPQQIGCAVSEDGEHFRRLSDSPILPCGAPGTWNSSESGHPYAFEDDDGRSYLFYQGSSDMGKTWYLSRAEIRFAEDRPAIV